MKRLVLILSLVLLLSACAELPPPADTAPPRTTAPVETTVPVETTLPPETTSPAFAAMTIEEAAALLDFSADPNWLPRSLGCIFEKPEDIDLYYLFYLGVDHPGSWDDIAPESEEFLLSQNFLRDMDLQIMPVEKM